MSSEIVLTSLLSAAVIEVMKQKQDLVVCNDFEYEFKVKVKLSVNDNALTDLQIKKIGFKRV